MIITGADTYKFLNKIRYPVCISLFCLLLGFTGCEKIEDKPFYKYPFVISIYEGTNIYDLMPRKDNPVLKGSDVTDAKVSFVADPFFIRKDKKWYMFFEAYKYEIHKGVIGYAVSEDDCYTWEYRKIIIDKPWHHSFPHVFEENGEYYMVPESKYSGSTLLYKAINFPEEWSEPVRILNTPLVDPVVFKKDGKWYLFGLHNSQLLLFYSENLDRGWKKHPASPVTKDIRYRRSGGSVYFNGKDYYRIAMDCESVYGNAIHILKILELTPSIYREIPVKENYNLHAGAAEWAKHGIHTLNILPLDDKKIVAVVDGY